MGTAILVFHEAGNRSRERESMPVIRLPEARSEVVTTGPSSVQSTLSARHTGPSANAGDGGFVTIVALDKNLWVTSGVNPVAVKPGAGQTGTGFPLFAGVYETFALKDGEKVALIEWT